MAEVRWRAFLPALILAPLVPGAPAAAILFGLQATGTEAVPLLMVSGILAFAVVLGAPTYLTFGAFAFWLTLRRATRGFFGFWLAALIANVVSAPVIFVAFLAYGHDAHFNATLFLVLFGCIFAPIWGGIFGVLYRRFGGFA